jgi:hypothetical protein
VRRQKAEGRRQKAEGRRQKAEGRRQRIFGGARSFSNLKKLYTLTFFLPPAGGAGVNLLYARDLHHFTGF